MRKTDNDVLDYLSSNPDTASEIDMLTFALYAIEKREWLSAYHEEHKQSPSSAEMETWIGNWTDQQLDRLRANADMFFDYSARAYLQAEIEEAKASVRNETLVKDVKAAGGFWRQLAIALITGILAPIIIAGVIILAAAQKYIPSPTDIVNKVGQPLKDGPAPK